MALNDRQGPTSGEKHRSLIPDGAGLILIVASFDVAFQFRNFYASFALFTAGLMSLSLNRQQHRFSWAARAARFVCTYAPTIVILTFAASALQDVGPYLTQVDFGMFYASALQLRTDPAHLYDLDAQNRMLASITGGLKNHYLSFPYPPFVAALFVPFSYLSFSHAYWAMIGCNLLLLFMAIHVQCRFLCQRRDQVLAIILAASALLPVYINFILGQMAFVGLLLFSLFAVDLLKEKTTRAGLWIGLLSYKMTLLPIPLLILLVMRAWKGIWMAIVVMLILLILSLAMVGPAGISANLHVLGMMTDPSLIPRMQSLRALTDYLGMPSWSFWLAATFIVGVLLAVIWRGGHPKWVLAGAVIAVLLVSPYLQMYDVCLGLLAIALAVSSISQVPDWKRAGLILLTFLPPFIGVTGLVTGSNRPAVPFTCLLLFFYCLRRALSERQKPLPDGGFPAEGSRIST